MSQPFPSTLANAEHTWTPVLCANCREPFAAEVSFGSRRALEVPLVCKACADWYQLRCLRCHRPLGATRGESHGAPVLFCTACSIADGGAARERALRERAAAQEPGETSNGDPDEAGEADSEEIEP